MGKRLVIIAYDEVERGASRQLAVLVAGKLRTYFANQKFEVHTTTGSTADHILGTLADQRHNSVGVQTPTDARFVGRDVADHINGLEEE